MEDAHLSIVTAEQDDLVTQKAGCVGKQFKRVGMQVHIFILQHAPIITHRAVVESDVKKKPFGRLS